jgi:hypothetical protein
MFSLKEYLFVLSIRIIRDQIDDNRFRTVTKRIRFSFFFRNIISAGTANITKEKAIAISANTVSSLRLGKTERVFDKKLTNR